MRVALPSRRTPISALPATKLAPDRIVSPAAILPTIVEAFQRHPLHRVLYVVDEGRTLLGVIALHDLQRAINARFNVRGPGVMGTLRQLRDLHRETAREVMRAAHAVRHETPLGEALWLLQSAKLDALPIVDARGRLVGEVATADFLELALDIAMTTSYDHPADRGRESPRRGGAPGDERGRRLDGADAR